MGSVETKGTLQEALFEGAGNDAGRNGDAFVSRGFGSKCARASAARNLNPVSFMTEAQLKKLDDAVTLHRNIATCNERLEALKADLIREAHRHEEDFTIIEG